MNIGLMFVNRVDLSGNHLAVCFEGKTFTYNQFNQRVNQLANGLGKLNIKKGDRIAVLLKNCNQYTETFFAAAKLGAILVPINWRLAARELHYILNDSGSQILIVDSEFREKLIDIQNDVSVKHYIYLNGDSDPFVSEDYEDFISRQSINEPLSIKEAGLEDPLIIMYTSGTTGRPKGAVLTHNNIFWTSFNQIIDWSITEKDVNLTVCPMFHVSGLLQFSLPTLHAGGTLHIHQHFNSQTLLQYVEKHKITTLFLVPSMWHMLLQNPDVETYQVDSLRVIGSGGASLPQVSMKKLLDIFGPIFFEGYGVTETASCTSFLRSHEVIEKRGSIGKAFIHNFMRVVNENGEDIKSGDIGEIILAGPTQMRGYWNMPEETEKAIKDGWYYTGDLATIDPEGFPSIVDRKKDMIISGGENIYPIEIEQVLYSHPKILECAIVGIPDEKWGEAVKAFIVLKPECKLTDEEVINYCIQNLASYKKPKYVEFVVQLPRTPSGKVQKHILRKLDSSRGLMNVSNTKL